MKIERKTIKVRDICEGYSNDVVEGVYGWNGKLNIRPQYQREFVYEEEQRSLVIDSIRQGYPLSVMYWAENPEDGTFEVIDGQQRTISICDFIMDAFSVDYRFWHNLMPDEQEEILDYELDVYIGYGGTPEERYDWFYRVNQSGEKLVNQELLNATFRGPWVSDARRYFSKPNCPAYNLAKDYVTGKPIRQDYLKTALIWMSNNDVIPFMKEHRYDDDAIPLWNYFQNVIKWVEKTFPKYYKEMKGVNWGALYNQFKDTELDIETLGNRVDELMLDKEINNKGGIYRYVLTGEEKALSIQEFDKKSKKLAYKSQEGRCKCCGEKFEEDDLEAVHIIPWRDGGKVSTENCQLVCRQCKKKIS